MNNQSENAGDILSQMDEFVNRVSVKKKIYHKIMEEFSKGSKIVSDLNDKDYFYDVVENFGPTLKASKAKVDLKTLYDVAFHSPSNSLIVANKGATLFSLSHKTGTPHIIRHIGCCVYKPGLGAELVNIGIVGNIYQDKVVVRSESACAASFIFGSQRCNCHHQWQAASELAAFLNPIQNLPNTKLGGEFESWVTEQFSRKGDRHLPKVDGSGMILMHLDSQSGMGSGYTEGEFAFDIFNRASLRHRGEYSAEQVYEVTMKGGFDSIGIMPDPRKENDGVGYQITPILLDWLGCSKNLILLSNNKDKIQHLENNGYKISRIKTIGMVNTAGMQEEEQRISDFGHLSDGSEITWQQEMERLKKDVCEHLGDEEEDVVQRFKKVG
jgi:GTP cyclohydrolase II